MIKKELDEHDLTYKLVAWVDLFKFECKEQKVPWTEEDEQAYKQIKDAIKEYYKHYYD